MQSIKWLLLCLLFGVTSFLCSQTPTASASSVKALNDPIFSVDSINKIQELSDILSSLDANHISAIQALWNNTEKLKGRTTFNETIDVVFDSLMGILNIEKGDRTLDAFVQSQPNWEGWRVAIGVTNFRQYNRHLIYSLLSQYGKKLRIEGQPISRTEEVGTPLDPIPEEKPVPSVFSQKALIFLFGIGFLSLIIGLLLSFLYTKKRFEKQKEKAMQVDERLDKLQKIITSIHSNLPTMNSRLDQLESEVRAFQKRDGEQLRAASAITAPQVPSPSVTISPPSVPSPPVSELVFAQQPLPNGIFNKTEKELKKRQTIFIIESSAGRHATQGTFTLVDDEDTLTMAFNTPDTYLPDVACEIRGSGNPQSAKITGGRVKKIGDKWAVDQRITIEFP